MDNSNVDDLLKISEDFKEKEQTIIRCRKIADYAILYTIYGKHVQEYINASFSFRANDPYSYTNQVNKKLFQNLFSKDYEMEFNQIIKMEKQLHIEKLQQMDEQGFNLKSVIKKISENQSEFFKIEVDSSIELIQKTKPKRLFEIKMYTSPKKSNRLLADYLTPSNLTHYLTTRDFLGLITFATIHDKDEPTKRVYYSKDYPEEYRYDWMLHFCVIDKKSLKDKSTSKQKANVITEGIFEDHEFFSNKLSLNSLNGSISLIENYVKVVEMSYQIEKLQKKLEETEDSLKKRQEELVVVKKAIEKEEQARIKEEQARKKEEQARMKEEQARKKEEQARKKLEMFIKEKGLALPDDYEFKK